MANAKISFARKVKDELISIPYSLARLRSLLAAYTRINGSISLNNRKTSLFLKTENAKIAKFLYSSFEELYGITPSLHYIKAMNFVHRTQYRVSIDEEVGLILGDLEINFLEGKISKGLVYDDELISAYFCGAFLASGSVNSPSSSNYHLEIALNEENYAKWFAKLFNRYHGGSFDIKMVKRRDKYILYLKKSDQISDFLILMGATDCALEFEEVRMNRDFEAIGNRLQNIDNANLKRSINAANKQMEDIKLIDDRIGISNLDNKKLATLLELRIEHEDASFSELATLMSEKLGREVSRSNVNHLFRQTKEIADKLRGN